MLPLEQLGPAAGVLARGYAFVVVGLRYLIVGAWAAAEAKGLIVRAVDAADTRARRLRVTKRGGELAVRAVAAVEGVDAAFFQATPDPAALLAMLRPLARRDGGRTG